MAKDREIDERIERIEEIIQQLKSGEVDSGMQNTFRGGPYFKSMYRNVAMFTPHVR